MRSDAVQKIGVAFDREVESPITGYASLPEVDGFVVFFSVERRVVEVGEQEADLFLEGLAYCGWSCSILFYKIFSSSSPSFPRLAF